MFARLISHTPQLGTSWALARTLIIFGQLLTLIFNQPHQIDILSIDAPVPGHCSGFKSIILPCVIENGMYGWKSHAIFLIGYCFVITGFFPPLSGIVHLYMAYSFGATITTTDGGDQVALVFATLALPILLVDTRINIWQPSNYKLSAKTSNFALLRNSTTTVFITLLKLQIAVIYLVACLAKLSVPEWADGTAIYYWATNPLLPPVSFAQEIIETLSSFGPAALIMTYGTLILEFFLGISLLLKNRGIKIALLLTGLIFHLTIGLFFAIWSFVLIMCGALVILLAPTDLHQLFPENKKAEQKESSLVEQQPGV